MADKPLKNRDLNDFDSEFDTDGYFKPSSSTDCTGLIPSMPETDWQKETYNELYNFAPVAPDKKIRKNDPIEM